MVGGAPILGTDAPPSGTKTAVEQAEQDWRTLTNRPQPEPVDWTAVAASSGIPKQQRALSQALDRARRRRLESSADPEDWMRVQACAGIWASVWLTVTPTENGLSFLDAEYAVLVRFRLRLPLQQEGAPCARLRRPPSNTSNLRMGASSMTRKAITLTLARGIRDCGPTATTVCGTPSVPNCSGSASRHTRSRKSRVFHTGRMCAPVGLASRQRTSRSTSLTRAASPRPRTSAAAVSPRLPSLKRHGRSGCEPIIKGDRRPVQHMT